MFALGDWLVVTLPGVLSIPVGLYLALARPRWLFWAFIVSLPFRQVIVLDIPAITFRLWLPVFWVGLLVGRKAIDVLTDPSNRSLPIGASHCLLGAFVVVLVLSLAMPVALHGTVATQPVDGPFLPIKPEPLSFTRTNVTQAIYPLFWGLAFLALFSEFRIPGTLKKVTGIAPGLAIVTVGSGIINQALRLSGRHELAVDIYAIMGGWDLSFVGKTIAGIPRIYSVVGEPGWTASFLIFTTGLLVGRAYAEIRDESPRRLWFLAGLAVSLGGLVLAGTTGRLAFGLFVVGIPVLLYRKGRAGRTISVLVVGVTLLVGIFAMFAAIASPSIYHYVAGEHVDKAQLETGSASTRLSYLRLNLQVFAESPILGVGYGSSKSPMLIAGLLSNVGLLGTATFLGFNGWLAWDNWRSSRHVATFAERWTNLAAVASLVPFVLVHLVAKSMGTLIAPWYWTLAAFAAASAMKARGTVLEDG